MYVAWLLRVEFGVLLLLFVASLARQLWRRFAARTWSAMAGSVEGWLLLAVVATTAARYVFDLARVAGRGAMPGVGTNSLAIFGAGCAIYLGAKAVRAVRTQS
jgi:hypothetical protein